MIEFLPAPTRLRPGFVVTEVTLEDEYAKPPLLIFNDAIKGPGIAEIKPHTAKQIGKAHEQLRDMKATARYRNSEALIVTYRPVGRTTGEGTPVRAYAVRYVPGAAPSVYLTKEAWWDLGQVVIPRRIGVNLADRSVFGAAAERAIRGNIGAVLARPPHNRGPNAVTTPAHKSPNEPGPDVEWREIAEMYAELARTTNDEFLAELANELTAAG
jgi:hypothetical protein